MNTETVLLLLGAFGAAAVASLGLTPASAWLARRVGAVDQPGGRHVHAGDVPRLGGVAVFLALLAGCSVYAVVFGWGALLGVLSKQHLVGFLAPCVIVWGVGLVDDVRGLSPAPRVAAVAIAATMLMQVGFVIDTVATPWGALDLGLAAFPITMLWFVGVTHSFNLIDGLDGLLATVGICSLLGCAAVGLYANMDGTAVLAVALAGALFGFLYWNRHPASVFMGDSGSLLVGLTTAALSLKVSKNINGAISAHIPIALCALPICETFLTLARRHVRGVPYLVGDRSHIHHVMLNKGIGVRTAVLTLGGFSFLMATAAFLSRFWRSSGGLVTVIVLLAVVAVGLRWLGYVEFRVVWQRLRRDAFRRRMRGLPQVLALSQAGETISGASSLAELRERLPRAVEEAGLAFLAYEPSTTTALDPERVVVSQGHNAAADRYLETHSDKSVWLFSADVSDPTMEFCGEQQLRLPLPPGGGHLGFLICHAYLGEGTRTLSATDVHQYLADPLARLLETLIAKPTDADSAQATPSPSTPRSPESQASSETR